MSNVNIAILRGTTTITGDLTSSNLLLTDSYVSSYFIVGHPWGSVVINNNGEIHYKSIKDPPVVEDTDAWKKKVGIILGLTTGLVALLLGLAYGLYTGLFPLGGAGAGTTASGGSQGGENNRDTNNENDNSRSTSVPSVPTPVQEITRNGLEALRDNMARGRTSGRVGSPYLVQNQLYNDPIPEFALQIG